LLFLLSATARPSGVAHPAPKTVGSEIN
jgi:hypothetical protein